MEECVEINEAATDVGEAVEDVDGFEVGADIMGIKHHFPCGGELVIGGDFIEVVVLDA